eukprot:gene15493-18401_t
MITGSINYYLIHNNHFDYTIKISKYATAPGFTATRALHACLRCDERYPLALNPKNSNANCLTNPLWKQGKSWKTLTKILLLTRCYSDCLYKTTAGKFATNYFRHESSPPL